MTAGVVADTHALIWYFEKSPKLSKAASERMRATIRAGGRIYVPAISLVEMTYLREKGRVSQEPLDRLIEHLDRVDSDLAVAPLDRGVAECVGRIPRDQLPDMPDRIIAATALHLGVPLVSIEGGVQVPGLEVVW